MTPAEIARRLTPAQRRALLWLPGDGRTVAIGIGSPSVAAREWLRAMDMMEARGVLRRLTPLGAAVRAEIEQESKT